MSIVYIPGVQRMANPSGYKLYDFLKQLCSNNEASACDWLTLFNKLYKSTNYSEEPIRMFSTDFIEGNIGSAYGEISDVYIFPHRISNSVGYIDIDDLIVESKANMKISGDSYYNDPLIYAFIWGTNGGATATALSVKLRYAENLSTSVPIVMFRYLDSYHREVKGYMTVKLTPDKNIAIEYTIGYIDEYGYFYIDTINTINIDYNIKDKWLFILTDHSSFDLSLYDDKLNKIGHLNYLAESTFDYTNKRELFIYKGYYDISGAKAIFQYDWIAIESQYV